MHVKKGEGEKGEGGIVRGGRKGKEGKASSL